MKWFWEYTVKLAPITVLLVVVLVTGLTVMTVLISPLPDFSDPTKGVSARGTPIKGAFLAFQNLLSRDDFSMSPNMATIDPHIYNTAQVFFQLMNGSTCTDDCGTEHVQFSKCDNLASNDKFQLTFASAGNVNLYTVEALQALCEWTEGVEQLSSVDPECPVHTLAGHVAHLANVTCSNLTSAHLNSVQHLLTMCAQYLYNGNLTANCVYTTCPGVPKVCTRDFSVFHILVYLTDMDFSKDLNKLTYTQVIVPLGNATKTHAMEFYDEFSRDYDDKLLELVGAESRIKTRLYARYLLEDFSLISAGLALILILTYIYTHSIIITISLVFDVIFSYALAFFFYFIVFRLTFFPFLNILAALLIVAVAADDLFLFYDILQQHRREQPDADMATLLQMTFRHAARSIFTTSFTTASALYTTTISNITAVKCFAVFSGTAIICNFFVILTFIPAVIVLQDKASKKFCTCSLPTSLEKLLSTLQKSYQQIFDYLIYKLVIYLYPVWVIMFTLLAAGAFIVVYYKPKFDLPTSAIIQLIDSDEITERYDAKLSQYFLYEQRTDSSAGQVVHFVWGVLPEDNGNPFDPYDKGAMHMDAYFDMTSPDAQEYMTSFCAHLRNASFIFDTCEQQVCTMELFNKFMLSPCINATSGDCCGHSQAPFQSDIFKLCFPPFMQVLADSLDEITLLGIPHFDDQADIVAYQASCQSRQQPVFKYDELRSFYEKITSFIEREKEVAPASVSNLFATTFLDFYDLQLSLSSGTYNAFGISLSIAFVVLLITTGNIITTIYSMATITFTIFVTIAILTLDGWKLNVFESIIVSLAIGLSVDFTIHYSIGYLLATEKSNRKIKISELLSRVGSPVFMAALTTFVAGIPVLWSKVWGYQQLGRFLTVVMGVSWTYATFYLLSLCRAIGPRNRQGYIPWPSQWNKCKNMMTEEGSILKKIPHPSRALRQPILSYIWPKAKCSQDDFMFGKFSRKPPINYKDNPYHIPRVCLPHATKDTSKDSPSLHQKSALAFPTSLYPGYLPRVRYHPDLFYPGRYPPYLRTQILLRSYTHSRADPYLSSLPR